MTTKGSKVKLQDLAKRIPFRLQREKIAQDPRQSKLLAFTKARQDEEWPKHRRIQQLTADETKTIEQDKAQQALWTNASASLVVRPAANEPSAPEPSAPMSRKRTAEEPADATWEPMAKMERMDHRKCECGYDLRATCYDQCFRCYKASSSKPDYRYVPTGRYHYNKYKDKMEPTTEKVNIRQHIVVRKHHRIGVDGFWTCKREGCSKTFDKSGPAANWEYCSFLCCKYRDLTGEVTPYE